MRLGMGLGLGNLLSGQPLTGFPNDFSFNFDGSNDYLDCGLIDITVHTNATMACWLKLDNFDSTYMFAGCHNSKRFYFGITNGKVPFYGVANAVGSGGSALTINAGEWNHFALVADGGTATFYMNGIAKDTVSYTQSSATNPNHPFIVGARNDGGTGAVSIANPVDGCIDEFAIWDSALDAPTIAKLGSKVLDLTKYSASNLKLWLRAGDKVLPESDASIARSDFYTDFDGSDDYVNIADNDALSFGNGSNDLPFSGTAWINPVDATNFQILFKDTEWQFYLNSSDKLALFFEDESSGAYEYAVDSGSAISQNVWTHVAFTYNGVGGASANAGMKLYVNGIESSYTLGDSGTYVAMENSANAVTIGKQGSNYSDGKISNVAIHKTTLDSQTIKQFAKSRYTPMRDNRFSVVDFDGSDDSLVADFSGNPLGKTYSFWMRTTDTNVNRRLFTLKTDSTFKASLFMDYACLLYTSPSPRD